LCSGGACVGFFFFQAEAGIRDGSVTGVQTCALPISARLRQRAAISRHGRRRAGPPRRRRRARPGGPSPVVPAPVPPALPARRTEIGRASCRERGESSVVAVSVKKK